MNMISYDKKRRDACGIYLKFTDTIKDTQDKTDVSVFN